MEIVSKSNEKIKYINSLKEKKYREKYSRYVLEGIKVIDEHLSLEEPNAPELIVLSKELLFKAQGGIELYEKIKHLKNVLEVSNSVFEYLSDTETPQGILLVLEKRENNLQDLNYKLLKEEKVIVLDKVSDSGNMGTIIRTAVAFGIKNVICTKGCVDVYSSKVIRSSMGAIEKVNIFNFDNGEMYKFSELLKEHGYILCGTDLKATKYLNETKPNNKIVYVLGNEANGMSEGVKILCNDLVKIPMENIQESLNVAIAAAILMYNGYVGGEIGGSKITD